MHTFPMISVLEKVRESRQNDFLPSSAPGDYLCKTEASLAAIFSPYTVAMDPTSSTAIMAAYRASWTAILLWHPQQEEWQLDILVYQLREDESVYMEEEKDGR